MSLQTVFVLLMLALHAGGTPSGVPLTAPAGSDEKPPSESLTAHLRLLSKERSLTFVVESEPVEEPATAIPLKLEANETVNDRVNRLADGYGYAAEKKGGIYILKKLYRSPKDLPDITPGEALKAITSVSKQLEQFNPRINAHTAGKYDSLSISIVSALTPDQMRRLANDGLPTQALAAGQQALVWSIARYIYVQGVADQVRETLLRCRAGLKGSAVFRYRTIRNERVFGVDTPGVPGIGFGPIDSRKRSLAALGIKITGYGTHNGKVTIDPEPDDSPPRIAPPRSMDSITLNEAVASLAPPKEDPSVYVVEPEIADKRVILVGAAMSPRIKVLRALARVYGLALREEADRILIAIPPFVGARDITDLNRALREALPDPLVRAITGRMYMENLAHPRRPFTLSDGNSGSAFRQLQQESTERVRSLVQPLVTDKQETVTLGSLDSRAKDAFATLLLSGGGVELAVNLAFRPAPLYISDFRKVILTGGVNKGDDGQSRMTFFFSIPDPATGILRGMVGFANGLLPED